MSSRRTGPNAANPPSDEWVALQGSSGYPLNWVGRSRSRLPPPSPPLPIFFHPIPSSDLDRAGLPGTTAISYSVLVSSRPLFLVPEDVNHQRETDRVATIPEPPSPLRFTGQLEPQTGEDSRLSSDEQKATLKKLKKEIYNPMPKRISRRVSLYYRDRASNGSSNVSRNVGDDDDDGKRCAICLEDFEPKEEVMVTPCDHMFHEDCIVPWAKSHGQCPVCRSVFGLKQNQSSYNDSNNGARAWVGGTTEEIATIVRLVEEAYRTGRIGR